MTNSETPEGICCICGHKLDSHIEETGGWRCHSLSSDAHQCECWLRKNKYAGEVKKEYYDLKTRFMGNEELQSLIKILREDS